MDKQNTYKIKRVIPFDQVKQDLTTCIVVFAEAYKYIPMNTKSVARLKKGRKFLNALAKTPAREIRIDATDNEIQLRMYIDLSFRRKDFNPQNPDIATAERDLNALESYIRAKAPLPILPPPRWYHNLFLYSLQIFFIIAIGVAIKLTMRYVDKPNISPAVQYDVPKVPLKPKDGISYKDVDVFLIPVFNFPEIAAQQLADDLSKNLGLKVKATNAMPRQEQAFNTFRNQMPADVYHAPMMNLSSRLLSDNPKCVYIAITGDSLYLQNTSMNFVYSTYFDNKHAILGIGQLCVALPENSSEAQKIVSLRVFKMTKRIIGRMYYKFTPSENTQSLMKSPLMTIKDVDDMSLDY